jgi:hypothetical protein
MAASISGFKTNFDGGMRSNRFYIEGPIPGSGVGAVNGFTPFHIRATQLPQLSTKTMSYDYFGRKYHYPGEKDYGTWSFTVLDDTGNGDLWKKFHSWQNTINNNFSNLSSTLNYKADNWRIHHLKLNGEDESHKVFIMNGCWPTAIQPISFSMSNPNSLNMFNVIMVYDSIQLLDGAGTEITASIVVSNPSAPTSD